MSRHNILKCLLIVIALKLLVSCTKMVEVDAPVTQVNAENVYLNDETAIAVLTGLYSRIAQTSGGFTGLDGLSVRGGLSADDFSLFGNVTTARLIAYYQNNLSPVTGFGSEFWSAWYTSIYYCNSALEGLEKSTQLSVHVKKQLTGETKFLRAFFHFYLTSCFGSIPIILTSDYKVNSLVSRNTKEQVYQQIIKDLKDAEELLSENFLNGSLQPYSGITERARPSKWAAKALLARVYLYYGDNANAELKATEVINSSLFALSAIENAFLRAGLNNKEAIWQIQPVATGWNTEDARVFVLINNTMGNSRPLQLSQSLKNAFEPGDKRNTDWVKDTTIGGNLIRLVYKYKVATLSTTTNPVPVTEYLMMLRLAEQYLIRAEARANFGNLNGAIADLNTIRQRARALATVAVPNPLPDLVSGSLTQQQVLDKVAQERRIELFAEMGHRWFDLKRTGKVDAVMQVETPIKGGAWQSYQQLYPILQTDIERNPNITQNPGY